MYLQLNAEPNNTSKIREVNQSLLDDLRRASMIVMNLSRLSSKNNEQIRVIHLTESIHPVIEISKSKLRESQIELEVVCPDALSLEINLGEWQQVLLNLLNNAIEALNQIEREHKRITITASSKNQTIYLHFADNGPGIRPGEESTIFDLHVTNKSSGIGLGLWLSKNIINRYQGTISAENIQGGGALFCLKFPQV